jgi:hypothetical protein
MCAGIQKETTENKKDADGSAESDVDTPEGLTDSLTLKNNLAEAQEEEDDEEEKARLATSVPRSPRTSRTTDLKGIEGDDSSRPSMTRRAISRGESVKPDKGTVAPVKRSASRAAALLADADVVTVDAANARPLSPRDRPPTPRNNEASPADDAAEASDVKPANDGVVVTEDPIAAPANAINSPPGSPSKNNETQAPADESLAESESGIGPKKKKVGKKKKHRLRAQTEPELSAESSAAVAAVDTPNATPVKEGVKRAPSTPVESKTVESGTPSGTPGTPPAIGRKKSSLFRIPLLQRWLSRKDTPEKVHKDKHGKAETPSKNDTPDNHPAEKPATSFEEMLNKKPDIDTSSELLLSDDENYKPPKDTPKKKRPKRVPGSVPRQSSDHVESSYDQSIEGSTSKSSPASRRAGKVVASAPSRQTLWSNFFKSQTTFLDRLSQLLADKPGSVGEVNTELDAFRSAHTKAVEKSHNDTIDGHAASLLSEVGTEYGIAVMAYRTRVESLNLSAENPALRPLRFLQLGYAGELEKLIAGLPKPSREFTNIVAVLNRVLHLATVVDINNPQAASTPKGPSSPPPELLQVQSDLVSLRGEFAVKLEESESARSSLSQEVTGLKQQLEGKDKLIEAMNKELRIVRKKDPLPGPGSSALEAQLRKEIELRDTAEKKALEFMNKFLEASQLVAKRQQQEAETTARVQTMENEIARLQRQLAIAVQQPTNGHAAGSVEATFERERRAFEELFERGKRELLEVIERGRSALGGETDNEPDTPRTKKKKGKKHGRQLSLSDNEQQRQAVSGPGLPPTVSSVGEAAMRLELENLRSAKRQLEQQNQELSMKVNNLTSAVRRASRSNLQIDIVQPLAKAVPSHVSSHLQHVHSDSDSTTGSSSPAVVPSVAHIAASSNVDSSGQSSDGNMPPKASPSGSPTIALRGSKSKKLKAVRFQSSEQSGDEQSKPSWKDNMRKTFGIPKKKNTSPSQPWRKPPGAPGGPINLKKPNKVDWTAGRGEASYWSDDVDSDTYGPGGATSGVRSSFDFLPRIRPVR